MIPIRLNKEAQDKHWVLISKQILKRISDFLNNPIRKGNGEPREYYVVNDVMKGFLNSINDEKNLKAYLQLENGQLKGKIEWFENNLKTAIFRPETKNDKCSEDDFHILYSIFVDHGYSHDNFRKLDFIQSLELETCHYCNRNYIYSLDEGGKIKPEIDHFYPKGIYPFLAASYYNLIPSCQTCNGFGGKGSEDTYKLGVKSPYEINHDDFHFTYEPADLNYINPITSKGIIEIKFDKDHEPNTTLFKLDDLYKKHEDHVLELIIKSQIEYSNDYRKSLQEFDKYIFSEAELNRMIVGNYTELNELHKRPLSKLYRDIAIELGLYK